jgi:glucokinase
MSSPLRVLVVTGLPAAGKSRLARELATRYGAPLLAKDSIKEPLLDVIGAGDSVASRRLSDASFAALFALARVQLAAGLSIVLEGNFRPHEHAAPLAALAAQPGRIELAQVLCEIDESVRQARLAARAGDPERHPGHRDADLIAPAPAPAAVLAISGPRFVHRGFDVLEWRTLSAELDHWWHAQT